MATISRALRTERDFDVLVIGGGHAGTEAAAAAARLGASVALVTSALETIGQMSCNPAIGGVAKGTVVREVDALGGIMARATDRATVQFRMLNRGKGPAVWAPRAQCDRGLYRRAVRSLLEAQPRLVTVQGTVAALLLDEAASTVLGVETLEGRRFGARAVVVTTGTFGRGRIHIGTTTNLAGGRAGESSTTHLAEQLERAGLTIGRFKTGTPPRIDGRTVAYDHLERQDSELAHLGYRWSHFDGGASAPPPLAQLPCWITYLGAPGKQIIADHIGESAMYGGAIASRGPRYCPSVEDKIVKFPDAERHQLFLEPEGLDTQELYVNGLSTSLPAPVQLELLRSVPGLERVAMTRAGYAIEYDYYPPTQLDATLAVRALRGLYFAGQINGTTGYEEAAGQGIAAGLNAGLAALGRAPLVLGRELSYIGVLVDDIVTRGVDEPYRLFTSRSEFRLTVRQDNALRRLAPLARDLGLYSAAEEAIVARRLADEDRARTLAEQTSIRPEQASAALEAAGSAPASHSLKVVDLARRQGVELRSLLAGAGVGADLAPEAVVTAELEIKYATYLARERTQADRVRRMGDVKLPADLAYPGLLTLSFEARQKLDAIRPATLAQAARVPGVSASDLQNLLFEVERRRRAPA
ncbi:MAG: tRNA-5-carboxymethylaminomethyl-2-thiouridine(34)synthesis protein MnmG [uncultured Gemmatimonadaceae bacterium]|uniref:tRNA uridine 5-carboxymethylaminomethyl modification enzyme MnmG n=1 Tax=uncultured Gemmatimonadaceae bacterium TaxID=246130 RepID=A0A6J4LT50_9BACT|nr:MAG: tRNA-5-carboxymethylaminomethyl-2-thiouridine(34)synthesis protein MnmG [uncultured Gemmatimonadaceae bacterium]